MTRQERTPREADVGEHREGERGAPACSLPLKATGFPCREQARDAEWPPDSPILLGFWLGQSAKSFRDFSITGEKKERKNTKTPGNPKAIWCRLWSISGTGPLENPLALQVGICIVAAKALGVLAHVATFWAGLRRGQQVGKAAFLATQWGLQQVAVAVGPRAEAQEPFSRAQWGGTDRLIKVALLEASLQAAGEVGSGRAGIKVREGSPTAPTTPFAEATGWGGHL